MTAITFSAPASAPEGSARRWLRRVTGLLLGAALPTYFFTWVLGFNALKAQVNGRIWCSGADSFFIDEKIKRLGQRTGITETLICRKGDVVVRRVREATMWATNFAVALGLSLLLLGVLVGVLMAYGRLRGRRAVRLG